MDAILEISHAVKHFPVRSGGLLRPHTKWLRAVDDVTLSVPRGSSFGIAGESGSGKTTLTRLVLLLETLTSGAVRFEGREVTGDGLDPKEILRYRGQVQAVFQDASSSMNPRHRVGDVITEPLEIQRGDMPARAMREVARTLLGGVGLPPETLQRFPHELSGGQRQRVAIARALSVEPSLVILDEPVSALDVSVRGQVLNLLADLQESRGLTYLIVAHDLALLRHVTDHIAVMYLGEIVEMGETEKVFREPVHPYTKGLLEAVPRPRAGLGERPAVAGEIASPLDPPAACRFHPRCPYAQDVCREVAPPLVPSPRGPLAACHVFNPADREAAWSSS